MFFPRQGCVRLIADKTADDDQKIVGQKNRRTEKSSDRKNFGKEHPNSASSIGLAVPVLLICLDDTSGYSVGLLIFPDFHFLRCKC
jgi:hypothetical protein